ncbi:hypothetical protein PL11201_80118 [Planktothrix sp. PCC 11201]|nr:hypothetical protein PL11201_1160001 [Planktothrix sp. PCC 11201]SKB13461.1 hypothetical protein PL11201_510089 [Planktothrix sp. PCC 11201]SKB15808.1 hypothetical protein PL11201_80118 [Planktothrix sp. PCC 11201]
MSKSQKENSEVCVDSRGGLPIALSSFSRSTDFSAPPVQLGFAR